MSLFDVIPEDLFSVLASKNRRLYMDALDVLWDLYQDRVKISHKSYLGSLLDRLQDALEVEILDEEDMNQEERENIRGRASFLIRKLKQKGWFEQEHGQGFEIYYSVPAYSSKLLELFQDLRQSKSPRGFSYVYGTYSALKTAEIEADSTNKMHSIDLAYENTKDLLNLLKMVFHNIKNYCKYQLELDDRNQIIEMVYDDFAKNIIETHIRPLKMRESVPKYRDFIQSTLLLWLEEPVFSEMVQAAMLDAPSMDFEACADELKRKVHWIHHQYNILEEDLLDEIDLQVRKYTRLSTQKMKILSNRDHSLHGQLTSLLQALSKTKDEDLLDQSKQVLQLTQEKHLSPQSLYHRKKPEKRGVITPFIVEETETSTEEAEEEVNRLLFSPYGKYKVFQFMEELFGERDEITSADFQIQGQKGYIMSFFALLYQDDSQCFYEIQVEEGRYQEEGSSIPQMTLRRKRKTAKDIQEEGTL